MSNPSALTVPEILAPAGDTQSFLAAIAAGADAIYCGLKMFSARMEADNFGIEEISRLTRLARKKEVRVYLALNTLIKEGELEKAWNILQKIVKYVPCHALIIQDPALVNLARKAGFKGEFHLSTLGNATSVSALLSARRSGFDRVVLPREFTIDDIKALAQSTVEDLSLEVFIHGALCYAISGRCYWSSWFGGKSGLRGRCVQPCRRVYDYKGQQQRFFSCMDFSIDVLAKILKAVPRVKTWKIEGRKKSPHYVYYTTLAYRLLRDHPERKKEALGYLDYAFSRTTSHYRFLSQRPKDVLDHSTETGSGLFTGRIKNPFDPYFITREDLLVGDLLRIGYEDDDAHRVQRVTRAVPKKGKFLLNKGARGKVKKGMPVFIIDRKEAHIQEKIFDLEQTLERMDKIQVKPGTLSIKLNLPKKHLAKSGIGKTTEMLLINGKPRRSSKAPARWLPLAPIMSKPSKQDKLSWWWLSPAIFPNTESDYQANIDKMIGAGARKFLLNAPWQISLFKQPEKLNLWAGPFCNIANTQTILRLKDMGFSGAVVSPELDQFTLLSLPENSILPLGSVIYGNWPLALSRIAPEQIRLNQPFMSPKGEGAWMGKINDIYALFPQWCLDIREKKKELIQSGYAMFIHMEQPLPRGMSMKKRPGLWNWDLKLL